MKKQNWMFVIMALVGALSSASKAMADGEYNLSLSDSYLAGIHTPKLGESEDASGEGARLCSFASAKKEVAGLIQEDDAAKASGASVLSSAQSSHGFF